MFGCPALPPSDVRFKSTPRRGRTGGRDRREVRSIAGKKEIAVLHQHMDRGPQLDNVLVVNGVVHDGQVAEP